MVSLLIGRSLSHEQDHDGPLSYFLIWWGIAYGHFRIKVNWDNDKFDRFCSLILYGFNQGKTGWRRVSPLF